MKTKMRTCKLLAVLLSLVMLIGSFSGLSVSASGYSPSAATSYAQTYWSNYNSSYSNYNSIGGDCANFVSQCLHAGGLEMTNGWYWYSYSNRSASWSSCPSMYTYFKKAGYTIIENPSDSQVLEGNPVLYYSSAKGRWSHAAICVGTNSSGTPVVAAHNNDRYGVNWKLGSSWSKRCTILINKNSGGGSSVTPQENLPIGALDVLECPNSRQIRVAGWAYDCDDLSQSLSVHVYVGGAAGSSTGHCYVINADHESSDLVANGISGNHRFDATIDVSEVETQEVYVYAINIGSGNENPCFGQGTVSIDNSAPIGALDVLECPNAGQIRVAGWAYDCDDLSQSLSVHVYIGGAAGSSTGHCYVISADHTSSDLTANGISGRHRFDATIDVSEVGVQEVYVYAINIGNGNGNPCFGQGSVTIENPEPIGAVDLFDSPESGKVRLAGWAYDKNDLSQSLDIHVYIGGPAGSDTGHCYDIGYANHKSSDLVANGISGNHRFDETFDVSETGEQEVYVYAINIGNGNGNPLIASGKVTISAVTTSTTEISQILKGDANNDATVTVADAVMLQKYLLGSGTLTNWENADLCEDDHINGFDLALLKQLLLEKG